MITSSISSVPWWSVLIWPITLTFLVILQKVIPSVINWLVSLSHGVGKEERRLFGEILNRKKLLNQMSMVSEYVKYVKLEREIIKLDQQLKPHVDERKASQGYAKNALSITMYIVLSLVFVLTMYNCYSSAIILDLRSEWFYPIGYFMGLPTGLSTVVGVPFFLLTLRTFVNSIVS